MYAFPAVCRWRVLFVRDSGDFASLSWDAKALLLLLWRKADLLGFVRTNARCLPALLGHRENSAQIEQGLAELESVGVLEVRGDSLFLLDFVDSQTAALSETRRPSSM